MDAKIKAEWLAALRSGEVEQCRDELANGFGFCCIGVGYQTLGRDCEEIIEEPDPTCLAASALNLPDGVEGTLVKMNDDEGLGFPEIADWIEQNL